MGGTVMDVQEFLRALTRFIECLEGLADAGGEIHKAAIPLIVELRERHQRIQGAMFGPISVGSEPGMLPTTGPAAGEVARPVVETDTGEEFTEEFTVVVGPDAGSDEIVPPITFDEFEIIPPANEEVEP